MSKCSVLGVIQTITPMESGTGRNGNQWTRVTIVVKEVSNSQYERNVAMEIYNDNITKINPTIGMMGEFRFEANSRYTEGIEGKPGRWFTSLTCFDFKPFQSQQVQQQPMQQPMPQYPSPGIQPMQYAYQTQQQGNWQPQTQMENKLPFDK